MVEPADILKELDTRLPIGLKCPVCQNEEFTIVKGYTRRDLTDKLEEFQVSGLNLPSFSVICTNCGYILDFSLGILGFLGKEGDNKNGK